MFQGVTCYAFKDRQLALHLRLVPGLLGGRRASKGAVMRDDLVKLWRLTVRELREATRRIEQQSGLVLRTRLRLRRWRKRWRKLRRRGRQTSSALNNGSVAERYCEWISYDGRDGAVRWRCRWCDCRPIRPYTRYEQQRLGFTCPEAPRSEARCS